ncbi:MAG TPA: hypothetical protein VHS99_23765, partial [Chloroflexota bacterium]|nr:hypothetical protein [Chloroflexota bacterium]
AGARRGAIGAGVGSWWSDFWDWLKGAAAKITHFIVSVAEEVYVGLRLIVDGIAYVFKQIVHAIEEVAHAIGALFVALAKAIEKVLEALSVLFHFEEIYWTHTFLRDQLLARVNGSGVTPGFAQAINTSVIPQLDGLFMGWEKSINQDLNTVADRIAGGGSTAASGAPALNGVLGSGATAHSTFTVAPRGSAQPSSHAPQCNWAMQKLQGGFGGGGGGQSPQPQMPAGAALTDGPPGADALAQFFEGFVNRLDTDATLSDQWQKVKSGLQGLGHTSSASAFMHQLLADLLRALALVVDAALVVGNALVDGALSVAASAISSLFDPQHGYLTEPLDIPVLSWLYQTLFDEPLTVLNAITLVCAIPVTVLWRVVEGKYPSQSLPTAASARPDAAQVGELPQLGQQIMGVFGGVARIAGGIVAAFRDYKGLAPANPIVPKLLLGCVVSLLATSFPLVTSAQPSPLTWATWGVAFANLFPPLLSMLVPSDLDPVEKELRAGEISFTISVISLILLTVWIVRAIVDPPPQTVAQGLAVASSMVAILPGLLNPIRLAGETGGLIVAVLDVVFGLVAGGFEIAAQFVS